ncbi:hypothetical protein [Pseudomonas qingdaonensis]|uniref:hypothetical protein n=1 Tax=Pseudomonas qingdaonensis TaxID=2056231 RepID=UPI002E172086|nr:hypothetical protein [Pseudomonas qingdaonensis]
MSAQYLPEELSFLTVSYDVHAVKKFSLLKSDYEADTWQIDGISRPLKFNIILDNGSRLCDKENKHLQEQVKAWIAVQGSEYIKLGGATKQRVTKRILIIASMLDYLFKSPYASLLRKYGLKVINEQIIRNLIYRITSKTTTAERFYYWPDLLFSHIKANYFSETLGLARNERTLSLEQCRFAQSAILAESGLTINEAIRRPGKVFNKIIDEIYENTIYGHRIFSLPDSLIFRKSPRSENSESFTRAPVRSKHERIVKQNFSTYMSCIESLQYIEILGFEPPDAASMDYLNEVSPKLFCLSDPDKYRSIPIEVGLKGLRSSIEFILRYGNLILNAYTAVLESCSISGMGLTTYVKHQGIIDHVPHELEGLNISTWSKLIKQTDYPNRYGHLGLHDYLLIFYGATQITIGALSARRQDELIKSNAHDYDHQTRSFGFYVGKSGLGDSREYAQRPIPNICLAASQLIEDFQAKLVTLGAHPHGLFSKPLHNQIAFGKSNVKNYNTALNKACEYFKLKCNNTKKGYFIRQHQLRRLFAQAFYWSAFGDLDILRWFLAHTDQAHVYRYITDHVPGAVLNTIKAEFTAEFISRGNETHSKLEEAIIAHFGTSSFSLLDREEFESYLVHMFETGQIVMEPDYFEQDNQSKLQFKYEIEYVQARSC